MDQTPVLPEQLQARLDAAEDLGLLGDVVTESARVLTGALGATFVLRDGELCYYASEDAIAPLWKGQRFELSRCISGWAMINDETAVVPDIFADPRIPVDAYRPTFVRSLTMVPVRAPEPVAAIGAYWSTARVPQPRQVAALEELAVAVGEAVRRIGTEGAPWAPNFKLPMQDSLRVPGPLSLVIDD
jgi:GAF domain-containing protein